MPDASVSLVMTFHSEGILAHKSLMAAARSLRSARNAGLRVSLVAVLDNATDETVRTVLNSGVPTALIVSDAGDAGEARNRGVSASEATWIGICDGDDYVSANWLAEGFAMGKNLDACVLHPDYLVGFGEEETYTKMPDMLNDRLPESCLLAYNPWPSCVLSRRSTFIDVPYQATRADCTGFGFEDWHWTCETVAAGYRHSTVPGTAYFYRRELSGRLGRESAVKALVRPSRLFARNNGKPA